MRELNVKEIQEVSGGPLPMAVLAGIHMIRAAKIVYGTYKAGAAAAKASGKAK